MNRTLLNSRRQTLSLGIASLLPYQWGRFDDTTTPSKHTFKSTGSGYRLLFRGNTCNFLIGAGGNNPFWCRVDGGPWYRPLLTGTRIPVADGLSDTWHLLEVISDISFLGFVNMLNSGTTCEVIGSQPQIAADPNFNASGTPLVIMSGTTGTESLFVNANDSFSSNGGIAPFVAQSKGTNSFRFTATVQAGYSLWAFNRVNALGWFVLETDGVAGAAVPGFGSTQFPVGPFANSFNWTPVGIGDGTQHEYTFVANRSNIVDSVILGGPLSSFSTASLASRKMAIFLGDSLTNGTACAGDNNQMRSWAYLACKQIAADTGTGVDCDNRAVDGRTTNNVLTNLTADLTAAKTPDAVVIWIGTNDGATNIQADYLSILNQIIATYPAAKIVCVGLATQQNSNFLIQNTRIQAAIAACTTPSNCTYLDITGFANYAACDGLHQTSPGGQTTCATNFKSAIRSAVGL